MNFIEKTRSALFWTISIRFIAQGFTWLSTIFVIRLVSPEAYGIVSMAEVAIAMLTLICTSGFSESVIQNRNITAKQITDFYGLYLVVCIIVGAIQFFSAPAVADYFKEPELIPVLKAFSIIYLCLPGLGMSSALLSKNMDFKKKSFADLCISVTTAILSLTLAYLGYQHWSLVIAMITTFVLRLFAYTVLARFYVLPTFRFENLSSMIYFGGLVTVTGIVWSLFTKIDIVIGGRYFTTIEIGVFAVAVHLASMPMVKLMPIVGQVAFPFYANYQDDRQQLHYYLLKGMRLGSIVVFPVFIGMSLTASYIVPLILGDNWLHVILPLSLMCLVMPLRFILNLFSPAVKALNKPMVNLTVALTQLILLSIAVLLFTDYSIMGLVYAWLIAAPVFFIICSWLFLKALQLPYSKFLYNLLPAAVCSMVMVIFLLVFRSLSSEYNLVFILCINITLGVVTYCGALKLLYSNVLKEFIGFAKRSA